jgi:hypothetical protein
MSPPGAIRAEINSRRPPRSFKALYRAPHLLLPLIDANDFRSLVRGTGQIVPSSQVLGQRDQFFEHLEVRWIWGAEIVR